MATRKLLEVITLKIYQFLSRKAKVTKKKYSSLQAIAKEKVFQLLEEHNG